MSIFVIRAHFGGMDCKCIYCESQKSGREFTEFHRDLVNDNLQYETKNKIWDESAEFCRNTVDSKGAIENPNTNFESGETKPYELRLDEWTDLDYRQWATFDELNDKAATLGRPVRFSEAPSVTAGDGGAKCVKPRRLAAGFMNITEHEHETCVSWSPNVASFRPPVNEGQKKTDFVSRKSRRRICRVGDWMKWYHSSLGFLTLTYARPKCDSEAKNDLDRLFKRIRRETRCKWFDHLWVAERTQKGLIHFHVFFAGFIPKEWVNNAWSEIVGYDAYPNIKKAHASSVGYIVKYMSKADRCPIVGRRWGASQRALHKSLPQKSRSIGMTWDEFLELHDGAKYTPRHILFQNGYTLKREGAVPGWERREWEAPNPLEISAPPKYQDILLKK